MTTCANCGVELPADFRFCPSCGTQRVGEAPGDPLIGRTLGSKYRVLERIGEGSMGTVYRAEHIALRKAIALKVLRRDLEVGEQELRRFQREGIAAGQLSHRNVTQVFDFDRAEDGLVFLAMELVEGRSLAEWLRGRGPLPIPLAVELERQLLASLIEAHRHGVIHRDLKPENIMVVEGHGSAPSLKVLDFGLSKLVDRSLESTHHTLPGRVVGTPLYMAPEQWRGEEVDARADLYSAALILFEMLAGARPFEGRDLAEVMVKATSSPPPSLREGKARLAVSEELDALVRKGLAKDPAQRFQTAEEMLRALDAIPLAGGRRRLDLMRPLRAAVLPVAAIAVVALTATAWWRLGRGGTAHGKTLVTSRPVEELSADERRYVDALASARRLIHDSDLDAARGAVERALALPCADAEGWLVRGLLDRARGDGEVAKTDVEKALAQRPGYAVAEAELGWIAFDRGDLDLASRSFESALHAEPELPEALAGRGAVLLGRGDAKGAVGMLDAAAGSHPDHGLVQYWRGRAKLETGDFAGALLAFGRASQSEEVAGWLVDAGLGDAYRGQGNGEGAKRKYGDALRFASEAHDVRRKLAALLIEEERFNDAFDALRPTLAARPDDPEVNVLRGLIEQGRGNADAAIAALEAGLAGKAAHPERLQALLANLELERGQADRAAGHCREAAALDDRRAGVFVTWGIALFRQEDFDGAAEKLERAVELEPADAFAHYCLGVIYRDYLGDSARALQHFEAHREHGGTRPKVEEWIRRLRG